MNADDFHVALLVITDGRRDCIRQTIPSALASLDGCITRWVVYDDSGDPEHRSWLMDTFPTFELIHHPDGRQGFGGAIRAAWSYVAAGREPFIFHLEDDFLFRRPVLVSNMVRVLLEHPEVVQLALRRQPWNEHERLAGGIVEQHPDAYTGCADGRGNAWLEHQLFFTTNPSLYRRSLCATEWPDGANSEGNFTHRLLDADPAARFGFWGARDSGEAVTHIGHDRVGTGY